MAALSDLIELDLGKLPEETELSRPVVEAIALAASVVLDRVHGPREGDDLTVEAGASKIRARLRRVAVDLRARETYGDAQEATEEGAEGVAVAVAGRVLNRVVFRRLPKGTGADYLMRDPSCAEGDGYERLECSGIAEGRELLSTRVREKLKQLGSFSRTQPGLAVVTDFRPSPVAVHIARWQP